MAEKGLTFHFPPDGSLENILALADGLTRMGDPTRASLADLLVAAAEVHELPQRSEVTNFAQRVGILPETAPWRLTNRAHAILACTPQVQRDLLHYLAYAAWRPEQKEKQVPFWSYRHTSDLLWQEGEVILKPASTKLVEEIVGVSREHFLGVPGYKQEQVSYSAKSVRGILAWLRALQPPVIVGDRFIRRQTCSAQLIVLGLGEAARQAGIQPGSDMLLSQDRREAVCRVCLLDPGYLDRMLDWALPQYPTLVTPGMRGGSYGRSVRLLRNPTVELVCPKREVVV